MVFNLSPLLFLRCHFVDFMIELRQFLRIHSRTVRPRMGSNQRNGFFFCSVADGQAARGLERRLRATPLMEGNGYFPVTDQVRSGTDRWHL